jgi:O-antigen ligase
MVVGCYNRRRVGVAGPCGCVRPPRLRAARCPYHWLDPRGARNPGSPRDDVERIRATAHVTWDFHDLQSIRSALTEASHAATVDWAQPRRLLRVAAAVVAFAATLAITASNQHAPLDIKIGPLAQVVAGIVPPIAALAAAAAIFRPWRAFLLIVLLTPVWDVAQVSWQIGWNVQVIAQTIFVVALAAGCLLRSPGLRAEPGAAETRHADPPAGAPPNPLRRLAGRFSGLSLPLRAGVVALIAILVIAALSTLNSPDHVASGTVLMHGILEPVAMGLILLALVPGRRGLALVAVVLGVSVAIGSLLNIVQMVPTSTLHQLQVNRLLFSRVTYFNVGLFGEMLAMAIPLLIGALMARRQLNLGRRGLDLVGAALALCTAGLFFTFSKSAWISTSGATVVVLLLLAGTWRKRAAIVLTAGLLSTAVIPWPALVLQVSPPLDNAYRAVMVAIVGQSRFDSWNPSTLSGRGSLVERTYTVTAAAHMAIDHPLLGVGLDRFGPEYVGGYKPAAAHLTPDSAHAFWPEIAAELGLPALAFVLLLYAAAMAALWRVYRSPPDNATKLLAAALIASLVAWLLVATAFAGDMYRPWRNMSSDFVMMAIVVAAAFALAHLAARDRRAGDTGLRSESAAES